MMSVTDSPDDESPNFVIADKVKNPKKNVTGKRSQLSHTYHRQVIDI